LAFCRLRRFCWRLPTTRRPNLRRSVSEGAPIQPARGARHSRAAAVQICPSRLLFLHWHFAGCGDSVGDCRVGGRRRTVFAVQPPGRRDCHHRASCSTIPPTATSTMRRGGCAR
jgi:hypothetical protein